MTRAPEPFPNELTIGEQIGRGRRSDVFAGEWRGQSVVVKRYTPQSIARYRRRYGVSIAQFEYRRNAAFFAAPDLRPFSPRPIAWTTTCSGRRRPDGEVFVQQRVEGRDLRELLDVTGRLPADVLSALDQLVDAASRHGLHDIDLSPTNFRMQADGERWRPVLFDFNLMPQHLHAPNPFVALLYRTGFRRPDHRDRWMLERLRHWPD